MNIIYKIVILLLTLILYRNLYSQQEQNYVKINHIIGSAEYYNESIEDWVELKIGDKITENTEIRINGIKDSVELELPDSSTIILLGITSIKLEKLFNIEQQKKKSIINLLIGKIYGKIQHKEDQEFTITTRTAVAAIRGTEFGIGYDPSTGGKLVVFDGRIEVRNAFGLYSPTIVNSGQKVLLPQKDTDPISDLIPINEFDINEFKQRVSQEENIIKQEEKQKPETKELPKQETKEEKKLDIKNEQKEEIKQQKQEEKKEIISSDTTQPINQAKTEQRQNEIKTEEIKNIPSNNQSSTQSLSGENFKLGFGINNLTIDNENWTQIKLFPVIPIWKFKFALDIELFINKGKISPKGWDFSTLDSTLDSIFRKIYFISFSEKENVTKGSEIFAFKIGALENVYLGNGIAMNNYNNILNYPIEKKLGLEITLGNITPLKYGLELIINNLGELVKGGGLIGVRTFINPLGFLKIQIISDLRTASFFVMDINQYSGLIDSDGDTYPDKIDKFPYNKNYYVDSDSDSIPDQNDLDLDGDGKLDYINLTMEQKSNLNNYLNSIGISNEVDFEISSNILFSLSNKNDFFCIYGFDVELPIFNFLTLYFQYAVNLDIYQPNDNKILEGWGISGPSLKISFMPNFEFNLEYRRKEGSFIFGYFDQKYENMRTKIDSTGLNIITKDNYVDTTTSANGIFGSMLLNLFIIYGYGSLEYLIPDTSTNIIEDLNANVEAKLFLNTNIIQNIKQVKDIIDSVEAYFVNKNITNLTLFFNPNPNMYFGIKARLKMGGNTKLVYYFERGFVLDSDNVSYKSDDKMGISTETIF